MNAAELAMQDPNVLADKDFIEAALSELESDITYIEQTHHVFLAGNRKDFDRARCDWLMLTRAQVMYAVSLWRRGIFSKYHHRVK